VTYAFSNAASGTANEVVVIAHLLADDRPETARFVAEVLGDASVTAEDKRR
jgi:hypothetical protein